METIQDSYFWEIYDKAREIAGQYGDWEQLETLREFACDQAGIDNDLRESIENSLDQQYIMVLWEMWKLMTHRA